MTYFRGRSHYHRRMAFHGRVRDGNGWDRQTIVTGNTGAASQPAISSWLPAVSQAVFRLEAKGYRDQLEEQPAWLIAELKADSFSACIQKKGDAKAFANILIKFKSQIQQRLPSLGADS